jgi:hypothetical protein
MRCAETFVMRLPDNYHQAAGSALAHRPDHTIDASHYFPLVPPWYLRSTSVVPPLYVRCSIGGTTEVLRRYYGGTTEVSAHSNGMALWHPGASLNSGAIPAGPARRKGGGELEDRRWKMEDGSLNPKQKAESRKLPCLALHVSHA